MTYQTQLKNSGFRLLNGAELKAVSGGTDPQGDEGPEIVVIGSRYSVTADWLALTNSSIDDYFGQLQDNPDQFSGDGGGGVSLLDKVPNIVDLGLNEREQALSLTLQLAKVPGPLADLIAKASGFLASYEFKVLLTTISNTVTDEIARALFGPPGESTGDRLEDFRRAYGPLSGPSSPDFPE